MTKLTRSLGLLAISFFLASCGGGGDADGNGTDGGGPTMPTDPPPPGPPPVNPPPGPMPPVATEYQGLLDAVDGIAARANQASSANPPPVPTTGNATYTGVFQTPLTANPADDVAGGLRLSVAFNGAPTTGSVTNLLNTTDQAFTGSFAITGTSVNAADQSLAADIGGTIRTPAGEAFTLNAELDGQFPSGPAFVFGVSDGTVTGPAGSTAVLGSFIAERN